MDFWFEFDDFFLFDSPPNIKNAVFNDILNVNLNLQDNFIYHQENGTLYTEFKAELNKPELQHIRDSFRLVSDNHLRILNKFFGNNATLEQAAFEYFVKARFSMMV